MEKKDILGKVHRSKDDLVSAVRNNTREERKCKEKREEDRRREEKREEEKREEKRAEDRQLEEIRRLREADQKRREKAKPPQKKKKRRRTQSKGPCFLGWAIQLKENEKQLLHVQHYQG